MRCYRPQLAGRAARRGRGGVGRGALGGTLGCPWLHVLLRLPQVLDQRGPRQRALQVAPRQHCKGAGAGRTGRGSAARLASPPGGGGPPARNTHRPEEQGAGVQLTGSIWVVGFAHIVIHGRQLALHLHRSRRHAPLSQAGSSHARVRLQQAASASQASAWQHGGMPLGLTTAAARTLPHACTAQL